MKESTNSITGMDFGFWSELSIKSSQKRRNLMLLVSVASDL